MEGQDTEWMRGQKSGLCQATGAQIIRKHHKQIGRCPRPIWSWAKWREATGARMGQQESQDQSWLPWEDIDGIGCGRQRWGPLFPVCMTKGTAGLLNYKQKHGRTSLVVQWLRLHAPCTTTKQQPLLAATRQSLGDSNKHPARPKIK